MSLVYSRHSLFSFWFHSSQERSFSCSRCWCSVTLTMVQAGPAESSQNCLRYMSASPHSSTGPDACHAQDSPAAASIFLSPTQDHCCSPMQEPGRFLLLLGGGHTLVRQDGCVESTKHFGFCHIYMVFNTFKFCLPGKLYLKYGPWAGLFCHSNLPEIGPKDTVLWRPKCGKKKKNHAKGSSYGTYARLMKHFCYPCDIQG